MRDEVGDGELWLRGRKQDRGQQISVWTHVVMEAEVGDTEENCEAVMQHGPLKVMTLLQLYSASTAGKNYYYYYGRH